MAHEFTGQARVDACADYRDVFLRERVCAKERVFRCQVGVGRGEEGRTRTIKECKYMCEIEGCGRWVVYRLCRLGVTAGSTLLANSCGAYRVLGSTLARRSTKCALFASK